ncbi:MAG: hypothetical protein H6818_17495 [Phycisphaerales bacterium]|nr:hypothetical protein [Phycisphaerales bacterium]MCB9864576.1 hypothetical protein [Phycisphaerales bacterium]
MARSIGLLRRRWLVATAPAALAVALLLSLAGNTVGQERQAPIIDPINIDPGPAIVCGDPSPPITPCNIVVNKELFITELCVVEDPVRTKWTAGGADPNALGAWTFGKLMASMAGQPDISTDPVAVSDFVRHWMEHWLVDQFQSGDPQCVAPARPFVQQFLIDPWEQISGGSTLNMKLAPFRLLAIVNRIDLRKNTVYGSGNAGEARFVFGVLAMDPNEPDPDRWSQTQFTVILEYTQPAETCDQVKNWANRWHALGSIPFGNTFNKELQKITDDFAGFNAAPGQPNGSSISQVRTNDFVLDRPWELREFHLNGDFNPAPLEQSVVALTVDLRHNNTQLLADYITANEIDILHEQHTVPLSFNGECFAAISSINPPDVWRAPGFDCTETRFKFAINNCNGCHSDPETGTRFLHVFPRDIGFESNLSRFLTGTPSGINDPTCPPPPDPIAVTRFFNDLKRRALDLCDLLSSNCEIDIFRREPAPQQSDSSPTSSESSAQPTTNKNIFEEAPNGPGNRVH